MEEQDKYYAPLDKNDERNIKKKQEKEEKELKKLQAKQAKLDAEKNDWSPGQFGLRLISLIVCIIFKVKLYVKNSMSSIR